MKQIWSSTGRYFQLFLDGQRFARIGGDNGLQEYARESDQRLLATGERPSHRLATGLSRRRRPRRIFSNQRHRSLRALAHDRPPDAELR